MSILAKASKMKIVHINCGVYEVIDFDNTVTFFCGTIEDCLRYVRSVW
jgi:hypothetical protein